MEFKLSDVANMTVCFPDGTECKVSDCTFEDILLNYKEIDLCNKVNFEPISFSGEFKIISCNTKAIKRLFKIKYPRKLKKKLFGTRRQRRKTCI